MPHRPLLFIVLAQFCCTSLWFAGNAVMDDLVAAFGLSPSAVGGLTSAVQFGFIAGTLFFAVLSLADRFSPSRVFLWAALAGAAVNLTATLAGNTLFTLLAGRFATGFCLAGIYPVGMKIAADYFDRGLGKSLGYLVGALVLGTAFPHGLRAFSGGFSWTFVLYATSLLAVFGGVLVGWGVPDGPYRKVGVRPDFRAFFRVFADAPFRRAAFGYFGHMWELYAFWTFLPLLLAAKAQVSGGGFAVSPWSFAVIAAGSVGCVAGGYLSLRYGPRRPARWFLAISGICCLVVPLFFHLLPLPLFLALLLLWGFTVVADSPLFSTLVAQRASPERKGTALTIVTCVGFAITILSIQLLGTWWPAGVEWMGILVVGPLVGFSATHV